MDHRHMVRRPASALVRNVTGIGVLVLAVVLGGAGCQFVGPRSIPRDRIDYLDSIGESWKRQTLMNILRLRYMDTPMFLDVSSVVASYGLGATVGANADFNSQNTTGGVSGSANFSNNPTITYVPLTGSNFLRSLIESVPPLSVLYLIEVGYPADFVFELGIESVNGLRNRTDHAGEVRRADPEFLEVAVLLRKIQAHGGVGLRIGEISENAQPENPGNEHAQSADEKQHESADKEQHEGADKKQPESADKKQSESADKKQHESTDKKERASPVKKPPPSAASNQSQSAGPKQEVIFMFHPARLTGESLEHVSAVKKLLQLSQDQDEFKVVFSPVREQPDELAINSRSIMQMMAALASFVEVPEADIADGAATPAPDAVQWTPPLLRVHSGISPPDNAFVSVHYQHSWFWIDNRDLRSKRTLSTVLFLFTLTDSDISGRVPVLTIPVK